MNSPQKPNTLSKAALSLGLILVSGAYALWQNLRAGEQPSVPSYQEANRALQQTLAEIASSTIPAPMPAPAPQPMMPGPMMRTGLYADGSYTGDAVDAFYGLVQVKAVVQGGKLVDVQFLQFPNDRQTSREISAQAMPLLTREAIQAQSANVNGVSGATETSGGFVTSLASALALAKR